MDIRDCIMQTLNEHGNTGAAGLGQQIADDLDSIGVVVDGDDVADRIRRSGIDWEADGTGALADWLAEDIEADLDEEEA